MTDITIFFAIIAGLVSFLSPCVLLLVPGFIAYLGGTSVEGAHNNRRSVFMSSVFFVLGFGVVFSILGVLFNTILQGVSSEVQIWLGRVGGAFIIFFGLYLTKLIRVPFLEREKKIAVKKKFSSRYLTAFLFGLSFAVGWTPCVGAILGAVLGLATSNPGSAFFLLLAYSFGLGIPFLIVGAFTAEAQRFISKFAKTANTINIVFGAFLIVFGVLVFTSNLNLIASFDFLNSFIL